MCNKSTKNFNIQFVKMFFKTNIKQWSKNFKNNLQSAVKDTELIKWNYSCAVYFKIKNLLWLKSDLILTGLYKSSSKNLTLLVRKCGLIIAVCSRKFHGADELSYVLNHVHTSTHYIVMICILEKQQLKS